MHQALVRRQGSDITLIAWHRMVSICLQAAERLQEKGIHAEVIDLRSLRPIDMPTLLESVKQTRHALVVEEDCLFGGAGAEIAAALTERAFNELEAPVWRVAAADVPTPYNAELEAASIPDTTRVVNAVQMVLSSKTAPKSR